MAKLTTNFSQRLQQSRMVILLLTIIGLFLGLWLCTTAIISLMTQESEIIYQVKTLTEGKNSVIQVDVNQIDMTNNNKLIHITGETIIDEIIVDKIFKIEVINVIKLRRIIQAYQWQEDSEHNYTKIWSEQFIDSKKFYDHKYHNPILPFTSKLFIAKQVILGDFIVSNKLIDDMDHYQKLPMQGLWQEQKNLQEILPNKQLHFIDGSYYIGESPKQPQIGDLKISFTAILPENISIIAKQQLQLLPYKTQIGGNIELFEYGILTSERMFRNARADLFANHLKLRLENMFAIFIGIYVIFHVLWMVSPSLLNPMNFRGWLLALIIAVALTLFIIAINWHEYNSIVGKVLFILSIGILYLLKFSYKPQLLVRETMIPQKRD
ncbi:MAG: TMEM43 family protein [Candidatus Marithrix sp.]